MKSREAFAWSIAAALLVAVVTNPREETITGAARVIDGDSLYVGNTEVRLHAADAFEGWQSCVRDSSPWACGEAAAEKLHALTVGREVACHKRNIDQYERTVAVCSNGEVDLGAELTRAGLALAYREFGTDYTDEEEEARDARRGAWAGEFTAPWAARRNRDGRLAPHADQPRDGAESDCRGTGIKGNLNGDGEQIYHAPGSANYDETVINRLGERWFCTEQEARRAGWRPPHN